MADENTLGFPGMQYSFFLDGMKRQQVVIRGSSASEVADIMSGLTDSGPDGDTESPISVILREYEVIKRAGMLILTPETLSDPPRQTETQSRQTYQRPTQREAQQGQGCPECGSPMEFRSGTSASTGKPWKGLFCTNKPACKHVKWTN